jgi:hypothetical protein
MDLEIRVQARLLPMWTKCEERCARRSLQRPAGHERGVAEDSKLEEACVQRCNGMGGECSVVEVSWCCLTF